MRKIAIAKSKIYYIKFNKEAIEANGLWVLWDQVYAEVPEEYRYDKLIDDLAIAALT